MTRILKWRYEILLLLVGVIPTLALALEAATGEDVSAIQIPGWFIAFVTLCTAVIGFGFRFVGKADERYIRREEMSKYVGRDDAFATFVTKHELSLRADSRDQRCKACDERMEALTTILMPRTEVEKELHYREKRDHDLANELQKHIILPGHPGSLEKIGALDTRVARMEERQVFHTEMLHSIAEATNAKVPKSSK